MDTKSKVALGCLWVALVGFGAIAIGMETEPWVGWTSFVFGCALLLGISAALKHAPGKNDPQFVSDVQSVLEPYRVAVEGLLNQVQGLTTFAEVQMWDGQAAQAIQRIQEMLVSAEQHRTETVPDATVSSDRNARKRHEHEVKKWTAAKQGLEQLEELLQEKIDFTPNDKDEQKALIAQLTEQKQQLQLQKRDLNAQIREIRREARARSATAPARISAQLVGLTNERRMIALQREARLRPHEDEKAGIDRQLLDLDRRMAWAKKITE